MTGVFEIAQVVEAVKLGAEDYITKPYNSSELLRRVEECIEASREGGYAGLPSCLSVGAMSDEFELPADLTLEDLNRMAIESALQRFGSNRTHAANALGISVRTLQRKLKSWAAMYEAAGACSE